MKTRLLSAFVGAVMLLTAPGASAALFQFDVGFTATFSTGGSVRPPENPVTGSFSFVADSAIAEQDGITPTAVTLIIDGHSYTAAETAVDADFVGGVLGKVLIGGIVNGNSFVTTGSGPDFFINLPEIGPGPGTDFMNYFTPSMPNRVFATSDITTTVSAKALAPVPLPAAAWLFLTGIGGLGVVGLRRRRIVRAARLA